MEESNTKLIVLTTAYNCEKWVGKCIDSIKNQSYPKFHCYILDDVSTDSTADQALKHIKEDSRFTLIRNEKKYYQVGNYDQVLRSDDVGADDVVIQVDGDDWLPDDKVFERVVDHYRDPDVWLTYGQFQYSDGRPGFAAPMTPGINIRKATFQLCALRSWKAFLWKSIRKEDLIDETGWYPHRGGDTFFMFPMVEMATHKHIKFLKEVNYIYNEDNPINDHKVSVQEQQKSANFARGKTPYGPLNMAFKYFTPLRFDLMAKLLYAAYRESGVQTSFAEEVYKEHLRAFTNGKFKEYDKPEKNSYEKYKKEFDNILDSIKDQGFDTSYPVPTDNNGNLLNGSHRVTSCFLHNRVPSSVIATDPRAGQLLCDSYYFKSAGLEQKYLDVMATEYVKLKSNTKVITLYPARNGSPEQEQAVDSMIKSSVPVIYEKELKLNSNGLFNYVSQMYFGEDWIKTASDPLAGIRHQTSKCEGNSPVKVYLVECGDLAKADKLKDDIRKVYCIGKPSVHINDNYDQTIRAVRAAFNDNSIKFMNTQKVDITTDLWKTLEIYREIIKNSGIPSDYFCITGSSLLELFGLRKANDLDYLHLDPAHVINGHPLINSHEKELEKYPMHKHDIILNSFNHFYFNDIKFATLESVNQMKAHRGEDKDQRDVELMKGALR